MFYNEWIILVSQMGRVYIAILLALLEVYSTILTERTLVLSKHSISFVHIL